MLYPVDFENITCFGTFAILIRSMNAFIFFLWSNYHRFWRNWLIRCGNIELWLWEEMSHKIALLPLYQQSQLECKGDKMKNIHVIRIACKTVMLDCDRPHTEKKTKHTRKFIIQMIKINFSAFLNCLMLFICYFPSKYKRSKIKSK